MSQYKDVKHGSYEARHSDHSAEIEAMRAKAAEIRAQESENPDPLEPEGLQVLVLECASALLEVHDDTGISLDDWKGPRELVEGALALTGFPEGTFLVNEV